MWKANGFVIWRAFFRNPCVALSCNPSTLKQKKQNHEFKEAWGENESWGISLFVSFQILFSFSHLKYIDTYTLLLNMYLKYIAFSKSVILLH